MSDYLHFFAFLMANKEALDRTVLIKAIHEAHGKITLVGRALGVTCQTIRNYARRYTTVQAAIDEARNDYDDGLLDEAELALRAAVRDKAAWAVKYTLSTKGKDRGYIERQELEHRGSEENPVVVKGYVGWSPDEWDSNETDS